MPKKWTCSLCSRTIIGHASVTRHLRNLKRSANDPNRCDNIVLVAPLIPGNIVEAAQAAQTAEGPAEPTVLICEPETPANTVNIARRVVTETGFVEKNRDFELVEDAGMEDARDMVQVQDAWTTYVQRVYRSCSKTFWRFFLPLHKLSRIAIDASLHAAKNTFVNEDNKKFPISKRSLFESKIMRVPSFWPLVMCRTEISLSGVIRKRKLTIPTHKQTIEFRFVDPLWAWLLAAQRQPPEDMQWTAKSLTRIGRPHDEYYGAGVQFGETFAEQCRSCPPGTLPMCVALHWDGAVAHGLHATPIQVGVGNTNSMDASTRYCIGYMPVVEDIGSTEDGGSIDIKHHIRQEVFAAIAVVMESAAKSGVLCRLPNSSGGNSVVRLMPRLISMNLDSKESRVFFGLQNELSCSKCRRRKGCSAFRRGTPQSGEQVCYFIFNMIYIHLII